MRLRFWSYQTDCNGFTTYWYLVEDQSPTTYYCFSFKLCC